MRTVVATLFVLCGLCAVTEAETRKETDRRRQPEERYVFVTGSLLPQRLERKAIGTKTFSPVRIIDRREIDQRGRFTTADILRGEPSLSIRGY